MLWQPRWYLFKQLEWRPEMTSCHETCHCWQVWLAGGCQSMSGDYTYLILWKILDICWPCNAKKKLKEEIPFSKAIWHLFFLHKAKWSREIKFHWPARTWRHLSPHCLSHLLSTHTHTQKKLFTIQTHHFLYFLLPLCPDFPLEPSFIHC